MLWQYLSDAVPENSEELESILLANRKVTDSEAYFKPKHPRDFSLAEVSIDETAMKVAVERIKKAAASKEKVLIFGDYDADGISATAILWNALKTIGVVAVPFIPRRDTHGYGITQKALDEIIAAGKPALIITVDNGIVAHQPIAYAVKQGIDVILTDHHQPDKNDKGVEIFPPAMAVVHTTKLCGSGVSWMLARELNPEAALQQLDIAALATIADQVPLQNANRSIAIHGLAALRKTRKVGLKALSELSNIDLSTLTAGSVGYTLAPKINAMGRLAHGLDALRLLCTGSWETARKLARTLADTNVNRQDLTQDQLETAIKQAELHKGESIIFVTSTEFHEGVIGLIAGRLVELFHKPALVMSLNTKAAKGSARSVVGVNVVELLRLVREDLLEVGGHPMAAGFGVSLEKIEMVRDKLFAVAKESIGADLLIPQLTADCKLPFSLATVETAETLNKFEPFGSGNPEPAFVFENMKVLGVQTIGKEQQHLKIMLCDCEDEKNRCESVFWRKGELSQKIKVGTTISLLGRLELNEWKGKKKIQLVVKDISTSSS